MTRSPYPRRPARGLGHRPGAWLALLAALAAGCGGLQGDDPASPSEPAASPPGDTPARPRGAWYAAPEEPMNAEQSARAGALEGIGYAAGMEPAAGRESGVGYLAEALVAPGLNFYTSGHGAEALLIDAEGEVLHRWRRPMEEIFPEKTGSFGYFRKARLFPGGVVLAVFEGQGLVALDRDSNVLWSHDRPFHHDVQVEPDGSYLALDREAKVFPALHPDRPLLDDGVVFLGQDGAIQGRISILRALLDSEHADVVLPLLQRRIRDGLALEIETKGKNAEALRAQPELLAKIDYVGDCLHTNSVRRVGPRFATASGNILEEGWLLVSIRELNLLAALEVAEDASSATARWIMRGEWEKQHEAVPLPDGRIMLFDNHGRPTKGPGKRSRVIDIDPATGSILRSIDGVDRVIFRSNVGGSCQRLAGGNTLVIVSTAGSAYEVTPDGRLAWAFHNPHRAGDDDQLIAFLPDVIRVPRSLVSDWLPPTPIPR